MKEAALVQAEAFFKPKGIAILDNLLLRAFQVCGVLTHRVLNAGQSCSSTLHTWNVHACLLSSETSVMQGEVWQLLKNKLSVGPMDGYCCLVAEDAMQPAGVLGTVEVSLQSEQVQACLVQASDRVERNTGRPQ